MVFGTGRLSQDRGGGIQLLAPGTSEGFTRGASLGYTEQMQPFILGSFMGVGTINQHFPLQLSCRPHVAQVRCQEISPLLRYWFFPPGFHGCPRSKRWPREVTQKRASSEARRLGFGMIRRVFSNLSDSVTLSWRIWLCSSFGLSDLIIFRRTPADRG